VTTPFQDQIAHPKLGGVELPRDYNFTPARNAVLYAPPDRNAGDAADWFTSLIFSESNVYPFAQLNSMFHIPVHFASANFHSWRKCAARVGLRRNNVRFIWKGRKLNGTEAVATRENLL